MARRPPEADERDERDDEDEAGEEAVIQTESGWMSNAPWWLVSAGIHVVLILVATLVVIEKTMAVDEGEVMVAIQPRNTAVVNEIERPRDVFERKGIPKDDQVAQPTEEPAIFFPEAKESDHNESADGEDYHQMKGDSKEFLSYIKGEGGGFRGRQMGKTPGVYDTMGVGGGAGGGGRYGGRFGGRENLVARGGGTRATESAVLAGLIWLARHQSEDGHWDADGFQTMCGKHAQGSCSGPGYPEFDTGLTGLSLLAFLGAGYTHLSRDVVGGINFGQVVKKATQWLMANQDAEGCIGGRSGSKYMYNHAIAALSLCEGYGMSSAQLLKEPAQKSINFLIAAQNPYKGWRYTAKSGDNDSSVTGWCVMALKSAEISGLSAGGGYAGSKAWFDEVTGDDFKVGYTAKGTGQVVVAGKNENFGNHEALTAIGIMARIFMEKNRSDPRLKGGADMLVKDVPVWDAAKIDFYYWYYSSLALFQLDGPNGPYWKAWNENMKNSLVPNQKTGKDGCLNGSWDPIDRWGFEGGRVYSTAINTLDLEVYYRYENVFGAPHDKK